MAELDAIVTVSILVFLLAIWLATPRDGPHAASDIYQKRG